MSTGKAIIVYVECFVIGASSAALGIHFESWTVAIAVFGIAIAIYDRSYLA